MVYQCDAGESVLQMALDFSPEDLLPEQFNTLKVPDLDLQNVTADQNGNITGLID